MALSIQIIVTVPKTILNMDGFPEAIAAAQKAKTEPRLRELFNSTIKGWKNPPDWKTEQKISHELISIKVFAAGSNADQYAMVNYGSPPHDIFPKNAPFLRFQKGYKAATKPRVLDSQALSRFGDYTSRTGVHHPGFVAREFTNVIAETHTPEFQADMQAAVADFVAKQKIK